MPSGNSTGWIEIAKFVSEIILAIVAVIISIIALFQTKKQIKLSNKQHLFDRRLEKYTIVEDIIIQYKCLTYLEIDFSSKDEIDDLARTILKSLYDCILLEDARWTIDKLTDSTNRDASHIFLSQCSKLSVLSKEITIIFNEEESDTVSKFIENYAMLILTIYHYYTLAKNEPKKETVWIKKIDDTNNKLQMLHKKIENNSIMNLLLDEIKL